MEVTCKIIKDILPLYYEDMLSDDSNAMVDEHLEGCQECKTYLDDMRTFNKIPKDINISPLLKIKSRLRKKKIQTSLLSIMFSVIVLIMIIIFLTAPEYLPYSEEVISISEIGSSAILATFSDNVSGYDIEAYKTEDKSAYVYHITTWNSIWNRNTNKSSINNTVLNPNGEHVVSVYYYHTDGSTDKLIYGKDMNPGGGILTLPRLVLAYYLLIAVILILVSGLIMLIFHRSKKIFNIIMKIFFLPVSYLLGHLITKGFETQSYTAGKDFLIILLTMIPLYIVFIVAINLIGEYRSKSN